MTFWEIVMVAYGAAFIAVAFVWGLLKLINWFYSNGYSFHTTAAILGFILLNIIVVLVYFVQ